MGDRISKLYNALQSGGYSGLGNENDFRKAMGDEGKRKALYGVLNENGYTGLGSVDEFSNSLAPKVASQPAQKVNAQEPVYKGHPELKQQLDKAGINTNPYSNSNNVAKSDKAIQPAVTKAGIVAKTVDPQGKLKKRTVNHAEEGVVDTMHPIQVNNETDVLSKYMTQFAYTDEGKKLNDVISFKQKEIQEKYFNELQGTDEFKALKSTLQGEELNKAANEMLQSAYGQKINEEMLPLTRNYQTRMLDRYKDKIEDNIKSIKKRDNINQIAVLEQDIDKQFEQRNSELSAKQEQNIKDNPYLSTFANFKPGGAPSVTQKENYDPIFNNLNAAKNLITEAREISAEAGKKGDSTFVSGLGRGLKDKTFDLNTWTFGAGEMADNKQLLDVVKKADAGQKLTKDEQTLMDAAVTNMATQAYFSSDLGRGYKAGQVTAQSIPFMLEILANPVAMTGEGIGNAVLRYGMKKFGKQVMKSALGTTVRVAGRLGGDVLAGTAVSATTGIGHGLADAEQRQIGNIEFEKEGNKDVYAGRTGQVDAETAYKKAAVSNAIEFWSEMTGGYAGKALGGLNKTGIAKSIKASAVGQFFEKVSSSDWAKQVAALEHRAQYNGPIGEYLEEVTGTIANSLTVGDQKLSDLKDVDKQIDTFLGVSVMGGVFSTVKTFGYRTPRYEASKAVQKAEKAVSGIFGEDWNDVKVSINDMNVDDRKIFLHNIATSEYTQQEKKAVFDYVGGVTKLEAINNADTKQASEGINPFDAITENKVQIYNNFNKKIREALNVVSPEDLDALDESVLKNDSQNAIDLIAGANGLNEDQVGKLHDYAIARLDFEDYKNGVETEIGKQKENAKRDVLKTVNPDMEGMIVTAKSVFSEEPIHIVGGNVSFNTDGTVDMDNSSEVIYYLDEEGKKKMASPDKFSSIENRQNPDELIQASQAEVENTILEKEEAEIEQPSGELTGLETQPTEQVTEQPTLELGQQYTTNEGQTGTLVRTTPEGNLILNTEQGDIQVEPQSIILSENVPENEGIAPTEQSNMSQSTPAGLSEDVQQETQNEQETSSQAPAVTTPVLEQSTNVSTEPIPLDEEGEPIFHQMPVEQSVSVLSELDKEDQDLLVDNNISNLSKEVEKLSKTKPKSTSFNKIKAEREEIKTKLAESQQKLDYWNNLKDVITKPVASVNPSMEISKGGLEARKEETAKAVEENNSKIGTIKQKFDAAPKVEGLQDEIILANGEKMKGRYILTEAEAVTPSHNPVVGYTKSEGFPVDENGRTVNDRDYENDKQAQLQVEQKAQKYDSRAIQNPVIVSNDGIVLSGNDRTMAGQIAANNGTDQSYKDYARNYSNKYGFTPEQVDGLKNPRILFVPDEQLPYNAETFAKFNADDKKTQNKTEQAVKAGKIINEQTVSKAASILDGFESLPEFYSDSQATKEMLHLLLNDGIIGQNEVAEMMDGESFSSIGKDFIENALIGSVLGESAVRKVMQMKDLRQVIVKSLTQIAQNKKFGDFSFENEITDAINLLYDAKKAGVKTGQTIDDYMRQGNLFGENALDLYGATVQMLANALNKGQLFFKRTLSAYNKQAEQASSGQSYLFKGDIRSKDEIINDVLNILGYEQGTRTTDSAKQPERGSSENETGNVTPINEGTGTAETSGESDSTDTTGAEGLNQQEKEAIAGVQALTKSDERAAIEKEAEKVNTNPSEAQKEAGNYKMGHIKVQGFDITLENPKGSERSGTDVKESSTPVETKDDIELVKTSDGVLPIKKRSISQQPKKVDVGGLFDSLNTKGEAKLSDHTVEEQVPEENPTGKSKWVDEEDAEEFASLRAQLRETVGSQLNAGVDPKIILLGGRMSYLIMKHGVRKFGEYAKAMIEEVGDTIRPHLQGLYEFARLSPEVKESAWANELTPHDEVIKFDIDNFDKIDTTPEIQETEPKAEKAEEKEPGSQKKNVSSEQEKLKTEKNGKEQKRGSERESTPVGEGTQQEVGGLDGDRIGSSNREHNVLDKGRSERIHNVHKNTEKLNQRNNHNERGVDYAPKSTGARFKANIAAIKLMKKLVDKKAIPTEDEMKTLRKYSGWGGMGLYFNKTSDENATLREALDAEEYDAAVMSINSAYYTPASVIDTLWDAAEKLGFKGGNVLEGSAGIGSIIGSMPQSMNEKSSIEAVEIDKVSGNILKLLYPDAKVNVQGFEDTNVPNNSVDLAITNVPFVTGLKVFDKVDKDLSKAFSNIHDFCIAKNIRKLKEGGIGIFITSNGTLDKSKKLREWITSKGNADVVGAFRMNNKTFEGTNATSDIIIIRKRVNGKQFPGAIDVLNTSVVRTAAYNIGKEWSNKKGDYVDVNKNVAIEHNTYFQQHPENMAGNMQFGFENNDTFRPESVGLYPAKGMNQEQMLKDWVESLSPAFGAVKQTETKEAESTAKREGTLFIDNSGDIVVSQYGKVVSVGVNKNKVKGKEKSECLNDYIAIKEALQAVLDNQYNSEDDKGLKQLLKKLNNAYDTFVSNYGSLNNNTSIAFLKNDVDFPAISAIEDYEEVKNQDGTVEKNIKKTAVFNQRVVGFKTEPEPKNLPDAIIASVYKFGNIDVSYIAEKLGKSENDVKRDIVSGKKGFVNPSTGLVEVRHEYLSGNVREKLELAKAANTNGEYKSNIEELEKVIPMDIPAHLIDFSLGSSWLDKEVYKEFMQEKTGVKCNIESVEGAWIINPNGNTNSEKNRATGVYSEVFKEVIPGHTLISAALNNKSVAVKKIIRHSDKTTETIYDKDATQACTTRIAELKDEFKEWMKSKISENEDLAEKVMRTYNDKFNCIVPKSIDEEFLPERFEGASVDITLYTHQKKAIVRGTTEPLMLAHEVGTGKTFTLISTAMEMRRLGTAKKPMVVVQNSTVGQFVSSAKKLYPNAKILTLTERDRTPEGRKAFYAKIKYNDWDIIVVPQSTFEKIPDSPEWQNYFINEKIEDKMHALEAMKETEGVDSRVIDALESELEALQDELVQVSTGTKKDAKSGEKAAQNAAVIAKEQLDRNTDDVEFFDQMDIDAILVDEAHEYKRLGFATTMTRGVKGIDPVGSKKAAGVYIKTRAILEKNGWKNVVFATGTPISNTAAEIWTFMKYLIHKDVMKANDIYYFDDFVRNFGSIMQSLEFATNGKFKENTRFASYINKPELIRLWASATDTVLTKDVDYVNDKVPEIEGGKAQDIYLPQSDSLIDIMNAVRKRLQEFEEMTGKEKKANSSIPLTMYGIAKRAAIDPRLVDKNAKDEPDSKTNKSVDEIVKSLEETKDYKGTVAVFCDNQRRWDYVDGKKVVGFDLFEEMKRKLVDKGVDESQIVIMKSGMSAAKKEKLFADVNAGNVRVVIGNTQTLGTGVNIQERLHTLIHMDAPDRPMDYTQRNGRILRQGNMHKQWNKPVLILRFGVEDSLDVTSYQRLKTKAGFIDSIMDGKLALANNQENRTLEEEEEGLFDNPVAVLSGSEYALKKNQAEREYRKYSNKKTQYEADQIYITNKSRRNAGQIKANEGLISDAKESLKNIENTFPEGKVKTVKIEGKKCSNETEIESALKELVNKKINEKVEAARGNGRYNGETVPFKISLDGVDVNAEVKITRETNYDDRFKAFRVTMHKDVTYSIDKLGLKNVPVSGGYVKGALTDILDNVITGKDAKEAIEVYERANARMQEENELMSKRSGKPFEFDNELNQAKEKVSEYTTLMKQELDEKNKKYEGRGNSEAVELSTETEEEEDNNGEISNEDYNPRYREDSLDKLVNDLSKKPSIQSDPFYSNAERAVQSIKQDKATPEQWLKMIEKNGGLKSGEDKWIGLSDFLKLSEEKTLTKQDILDFINKNKVQINEVPYEEKEILSPEEEREQRDQIEENIQDQKMDIEIDADSETRLEFGIEEPIFIEGNSYSIGDADEETMNDIAKEKGYDNADDLLNAMGEHFSNLVEEKIQKARKNYTDDGVHPINKTRLEYTTKGLENKKEIVLTVPTVNSWNENDNIHFGEAGEGRAVAWVRFGETTDKDGNRVLVIDEIQSKRHQEGREQGYTKVDSKELKTQWNDAKKEYSDFFTDMRKKYSPLFNNTTEDKDKLTQDEKDRYTNANERLLDLSTQLRDVDTKIPDAPFEKNWQELAMKRMLRYAAENGYDKVAWTTGAQQAERYNLSKIASKIQYWKSETDGYTGLTIYDTNGTPMDGYNGDEFKNEELTNILGKDLSERILNDDYSKGEEVRSIEGDDLKIGGNGMKSFYDQMLPSFMNKYGKKWGVKTGTVELPHVEEAGRTMHSVDVTPEMQESVMQGQPMFRQSDSAGERNHQIKGEAEKLASTLNVKVHIIENVEDIKDQNKTTEIRKRKSSGWFDTKTGEVYIVLPNAKDAMDVRKTILHEVVAHKGLRDMLGEEFDPMLDSVWEGMDKKSKEKFLAKYKNERIAADEYLASIAEEGIEPSAWVKVKGFVKEAFRKIGIDLEMHDADVKYLLWKSKNRLMKGDTELDIINKVSSDVRMREKMEDEKATTLLDSEGIPNDYMLFRDGDEAENLLKHIEENTKSIKEIINAKRGLKNLITDPVARRSLGMCISEGLFDNAIKLKTLQHSIEERKSKQLGTRYYLESFQNPYQYITTIPKRNQYMTEKYNEKFMRPIYLVMNRIIKQGSSEKALYSYLYAKSGLERNEKMRIKEMQAYLESLDDDFKEDYLNDFSLVQSLNDIVFPDETTEKYRTQLAVKDFSGLTELKYILFDGKEKRNENDIKNWLDEYEQKYNEDGNLDYLWSNINSATKETLRNEFLSGKIDKETLDNISAMYDYYIPLRDWEGDHADDVWEYASGDRGEGIGNVLKTAKGRKSLAGNPIVNIGLMAQQSIHSGNRNALKQMFLSMARNANHEALRVSPVWIMKTLDESGKEVWKEMAPEWDANPEIFQNNVEEFETRMAELEEEGNARKKYTRSSIKLPIQKRQADEHTVVAYEAGRRYFVTVLSDPAIARAINGNANESYNVLKGNSVKSDIAQGLIKTSGAIMRTMGKSFTTWNPEFVLRNMQRDIMQATMVSGVKENAGYTKDLTLNMASPAVHAAIMRAVMGKPNMSNPIDRMFEEYVSNGGETGYSELFSNEDFEKQIKKELHGKKVNLMRVLDVYLDNVEHLNRWAENVSRFSTYKTSRELGRDVYRSVYDAKEITVNFNRSGSGAWLGNVLKTVYIFSGAGLQAAYQQGRLLNNPKTRYKSLAMLSLIGMAGFLIPLMNEMLLGGGGDDVEENYDYKSDYERKSNMMIRIGKGEFVKISIPQEVRPFWNIGESLYHMSKGNSNPLETSASIVLGFAQLLPFDPFGSSGLYPTVLQPIEQVRTNENFYGGPIHKEDNMFNKFEPQHTKAFKSVSPIAKSISVWMNGLSGGDDAKQGYIDVNPGDMETLFQGYFGGAAKFINNIGKTVHGLKKKSDGDGEFLDTRNIPIIGSFYTDSKNPVSKEVDRLYWDCVERSEEIFSWENDYKKLMKLHPDKMEEYMNKLIDLRQSNDYLIARTIQQYSEPIQDMNKKAQSVEGESKQFILDLIKMQKKAMIDRVKELEKPNKNKHEEE